jgi:hypothetical protein
MSRDILSTLDLEDLTPRQLRKLLSGAARASMLRSKRPKDEDQDKDDDEQDKENDDLVDLHREKKGDSKPPKVDKDDLPESVKNDLDPVPEEDTKEMLAKSKKKGE